VPIDIVSPTTTIQNLPLSKFVITDPAKTNGALVVIKNLDGIIIYEINSIVLDKHLNVIDGTATLSLNSNSEGIIGLGERISDDLFLDSGVYSMWSRDTADPPEDGQLPANNLYGSHPFFMAKATDNKWFGVYTNVAAAQDWWINNHKSKS